MKLEDITRHPELPSLPEAVIRLNELIASDAPLPEIAAVLENEPSLALRTLELANSAWYKREKTIGSVNDAIAIIGISAIYQLIFSTSVTRAFQGIETDIIDMKIFWQQSVQTATLAQTIATQHKSSVLHHIFTIGLVASIGRLALINVAPYMAQRVFKQAKEESVPLHVAEQTQLGFTHNAISASIMQNWKIPASIYGPISCYIHPELAVEQHRLPASILNIAHHIQCNFYPQNTGFRDITGDPDKSVMEYLAIPETQLSVLAESASHLYTEASAILGL